LIHLDHKLRKRVLVFQAVKQVRHLLTHSVAVPVTLFARTVVEEQKARRFGEGATTALRTVAVDLLGVERRQGLQALCAIL